MMGRTVLRTGSHSKSRLLVLRPTTRLRAIGQLRQGNGIILFLVLGHAVDFKLAQFHAARLEPETEPFIRHDDGLGKVRADQVDVKGFLVRRIILLQRGCGQRVGPAGLVERRRIPLVWPG